jgi:hypothetical protein
MPNNSVFHDLLKRVPWGEFDRLVAAHGSDARVRRLSTKSQLIALLDAQVSAASSLREIEAGLNSHALRLDHLGAKPARRSTLADANALRRRRCLPTCSPGWPSGRIAVCAERWRKQPISSTPPGCG